MGGDRRQLLSARQGILDKRMPCGQVRKRLEPGGPVVLGSRKSRIALWKVRGGREDKRSLDVVSIRDRWFKVFAGAHHDNDVACQLAVGGAKRAIARESPGGQRIVAASSRSVPSEPLA